MRERILANKKPLYLNYVRRIFPHSRSMTQDQRHWHMSRGVIRLIARCRDNEQLAIHVAGSQIRREYFILNTKILGLLRSEREMGCTQQEASRLLMNMATKVQFHKLMRSLMMVMISFASFGGGCWSTTLITMNRFLLARRHENKKLENVSQQEESRT